MNSETTESRIAITIYLPEDLSQAVERIKTETGVSYPNYESKVPHITIYSCKFDPAKFPELVERIKDLGLPSFSLKLGELELDEFNRGSTNSFVSIGFVDQGPLRALHEALWPVANTLRGGLVRAKDVERFHKGIYSPETFARIQKYGYEHVGEHFRPHITLGEIDTRDTARLAQLRTLSALCVGREFVVESLCLVLSTRLVADEKKAKESEKVMIKLESRV